MPSAWLRGKLHKLIMCVLPLATVCCWPGPVSAAPKTDILILENSDRMTGEVKGLDRGKLSFNTDATGTISMEWEDVGQLISNQVMLVETALGTTLLGRLGEPEASGRLRVLTAYGPQDVSLLAVVRMAPIEGKWLDRLKGDVSAGYSAVSANDQTQFNFALDADYRTEVALFNLNISP
jgi:hypothetical protein